MFTRQRKHCVSEDKIRQTDCSDLIRSAVLCAVCTALKALLKSGDMEIRQTDSGVVHK